MNAIGASLLVNVVILSGISRMFIGWEQDFGKLRKAQIDGKDIGAQKEVTRGPISKKYFDGKRADVPIAEKYLAMSASIRSIIL